MKIYIKKYQFQILVVFSLIFSADTDLETPKNYPGI